MKKILVVEDDESFRASLADGLAKFNYEVSTAGDGEQAVQLILDEKPDLVLLDLLLPKLDGYHVLDRLRHYPDQTVAATKVIILSNLWSDKDILRAQALKIDEYFVKANTNLQDVFAKVRAVLSS